MRSRWTILAILFTVRTTMAVQFQSVGSVAPLFSRDLGIDLADVGILIGLYFAPGIALARPGGAMGQRYGDKITVLGALGLMSIGGLMMAFLPTWEGQIAGRLVSGTGGVIINVLMAKMVADWFANRELATAMAIFINSWPAGIAASLLVLPAIGSSYGLALVFVVVTAFIAIAMLLLMLFYQPAINELIGTTNHRSLDRSVVTAVIACGSLWALYNISFAMIFSFGPAMLVERGWSIVEAGSATSLVLWLSTISGPLGGFVADYTKRHDVVLVGCCIGTAALMVLASHGGPVIATMVALGLIAALASGPIMRLPALVLAPEVRAFGMGLFYTTYYVGMLIGPALAGRYAAWAGTAGAALDFGAALLMLCPATLWIFYLLARPRIAAAS
jgi:MFS family permease